MSKLLAAVLFSGALLGARAEAACQASKLGIPSQARFDQFFSEFQAAIRAGNSGKISEMATYPITIHSRLGPLTFRTQGEFRSMVSLLLNDHVKDVIGKRTLSDLKCDKHEVTFQGGSVGVRWLGDRVGVSSITLN